MFHLRKANKAQSIDRLAIDSDGYRTIDKPIICKFQAAIVCSETVIMPFLADASTFRIRARRVTL